MYDLTSAARELLLQMMKTLIDPSKMVWPVRSKSSASFQITAFQYRNQIYRTCLQRRSSSGVSSICGLGSRFVWMNLCRQWWCDADLSIMCSVHVGISHGIQNDSFDLHRPREGACSQAEESYRGSCSGRRCGRCCWCCRGSCDGARRAERKYVSVLCLTSGCAC